MGAETGLASWYGETHRGRLMADGKPFNPEDYTAASWFYPLETRVRVSLCSDAGKSVEATITDRGPAHYLLKQGRIIDLSEAAFKKLAPVEKGLVVIRVEAVKQLENQRTEARARERAHGQGGKEQEETGNRGSAEVVAVPIHGEIKSLSDAVDGGIAEQAAGLANVGQ